MHSSLCVNCFHFTVAIWISNYSITCETRKNCKLSSYWSVEMVAFYFSWSLSSERLVPFSLWAILSSDFLELHSVSISYCLFPLTWINFLESMLGTFWHNHAYLTQLFSKQQTTDLDCSNMRENQERRSREGRGFAIVAHPPMQPRYYTLPVTCEYSLPFPVDISRVNSPGPAREQRWRTIME